MFSKKITMFFHSSPILFVEFSGSHLDVFFLLNSADVVQKVMKDKREGFMKPTHRIMSWIKAQKSQNLLPFNFDKVLLGMPNGLVLCSLYKQQGSPTTRFSSLYRQISPFLTCLTLSTQLLKLLYTEIENGLWIKFLTVFKFGADVANSDKGGQGKERALLQQGLCLAH